MTCTLMMCTPMRCRPVVHVHEVHAREVSQLHAISALACGELPQYVLVFE